MGYGNHCDFREGDHPKNRAEVISAIEPSKSVQQWSDMALLSKPHVGIATAQRTVDEEFGPLLIFERPARQAADPLPQLSDAVLRAGSNVKLNIQITNVPELSAPIQPEQLMDYVGEVFRSGAESVRATENYMATPNAVNDSLRGIGPVLDTAIDYYAQTPMNKVAADAGSAVMTVAEVIDGTLATALAPEERAVVAGSLMPIFFFEGNISEPINPETVEQIALHKMSDRELATLGISRVVRDSGDMHMPEVPEHLKHLEFPPITEDLVSAIERKGRKVHIAEPESKLWMELEIAHANAKVIYPWCNEIMVKSNAPRVALLEEYLHGTQQKLGILDQPGMPRHLPEVHVKDFMLRHARMLGLNENEVQLLRDLKTRAINGLNNEGYRWTGK